MKLIKPYVPKNCLNQIYNALVKLYFDYCSLIWQNCKLEKQIKLQKLHNRAARVITGDNWEIRSKDVLNKLNWKNLHERRLFETLMFMRKILKNEVPALISELYQTSSNQYNLLSNDTMLKLAKPKTNAMKRSFSYYGASCPSQKLNRENICNIVRFKVVLTCLIKFNVRPLGMCVENKRLHSF